MILIVSREEKELVTRLRTLGPLSETAGLSAEVIALKRQIADLEIKKGQIEEEHAKQDRELRHMIGLEKKRQQVELVQAKKDTELTVREGNLVAEKARFEEQLKFNTQRFETMEKYLKDMLTDILQRLPNVNLKITESRGTTAQP
jgi:hypothetical protein